MVDFNGTMYTYVHNLQGDIVAILDNTGNIVVEYKYDAWGRTIATNGSMAASLGKLNPFRYRGYVHDEETGLYYLRSRYYSAQTARFINADIYVQTEMRFLAKNVFSYCENIPSARYDPDGLWTVGLSLGLNLTAFLGCSISIGFVFDDDGNFDWQWSYVVPGMDDTASVGTVGTSAGLTLQVTDSDTVYGLCSPSTYIGGSIEVCPLGPGSVTVGGDIISFSEASSSTSEINGFQLTASYSLGPKGIPAEVHVTTSNTKSVTTISLPNKKWIQRSIAQKSSRRNVYNRAVVQ